MKKYKCKAKIIANDKILGDARSGEYFLLRLRAPDIARASRPGQFVNISCRQGYKPFFRRPFDFRTVNATTIEILYRVVGEGTRFMAAQTSGVLDLIGPLGNGFRFPEKTEPHDTIVILAGGIGITPLMGVSAAFKKSKAEKKAFIGVRSRKFLIEAPELALHGFQTKIIVDAIKKQKPVYAVDVARRYLEKRTKLPGSIYTYAIGPIGMITPLAKVARDFDIPVQISYEVMMGCGYGVCRGCNIMTKNGYQMVCQDGPVFDARMVTDERFTG